MENVLHPTFRLEEQALTDKDIQTFMAYHNVELPDDFINHYLKHNGGWPNANWSVGEENIIPFTHFLSIKYGERTINKAIVDITNQQLGLGNRMPFAVNAIGGYYFIATDVEDFGRIFYARIIASEDKKKKLLDWQNHCVNFSDFMSRFQVDKIYGTVVDPKLQRRIEDFDAYVREHSL